MARTIARALLAAATLALYAAPASAQGVADFYRGKTINIICGFGPGGGYDLYPRVLARHFSRHMPGNPTVVVQNMEGVGSARAANYVFNVAAKDGTAIAAVNQNMPMYQLLGGAGAQFEAAKLQYLGSMGSSNGLIYTLYTMGIKTIADAKQHEVPLAAVGTTSDSHIFPTIVNALVGTKFKPIPGYTGGTGQINIAVERGEVMGRGGTSWSSVQTSNKSWLDGHKLNFLVQIGFRKEPDLPSVPLLQDLVTSPDDLAVVKGISPPTALG